MKYRCYATAAATLALAGSLVYAAPRARRVTEEMLERVAPHEDADMVLEALMRDVIEEVTEDGKLMVRGVTGAETAIDGSVHVNVGYGGDFDRDLVLTIPRPALFDERGEFVAVQGPNRIRLLDDHIVYIFGPVTDAGKAASTTAKTEVNRPGTDDGCTLIIAYPTFKPSCQGECAGGYECIMVTIEDAQGNHDILCQCGIPF